MTDGSSPSGKATAFEADTAGSTPADPTITLVVGAPHVKKYTEEFRQNELLKGEQSLLYFGHSILGFTALNERTGKSQINEALHGDLCAFLEGRRPHHPWNRAMICGFRGSAKSTWATITYPFWRGVYVVNFSTKLIENSSDNAKVNHFLPLIELLKRSARADYLNWLLSHRIPDGWEGTNSDQLVLLRTDPLAKPTLSYMGIDSKGEGSHTSMVVLDDPEGADADKSNVGNEEAFRAYERSTPLLVDPHTGQILLVCTPHGAKPLAYRQRRIHGWKTEADNATSGLKIWWRPILDERGKSRWPERFPPAVIDGLRKSTIWDTQYMLRERGGDASMFDMVAIKEALYEWADPITRKAIAYRAFSFNPDDISDDGYVRPPRVDASVNIKDLRMFAHLDPLHKTLATRRSPLSKQRPAKAAIAVVGVARDLHAFLLDYWCDDTADIGKQAAELFRLYLKWECYKLTWESVGAQFWLKTWIENMEKQRMEWGRPLSTGFITGTRLPLPRLSTRLVEASKTIESKEDVHREVLSPWTNYGVLHLRQDQDEPLYQLENAQNEDCPVDIVDCLGQGPEIWSAPAGDIFGREFARRRFIGAFVQKAKGVLGGGRRW